MNFKVLFFVLVILFTLGAATFGVFYFLKDKAYDELQAENNSLRSLNTNRSDKTTETTETTTNEATISELNDQIKTLTSQKAAAEKAKTDAETAKTEAETAKATAENNLAIANSNKSIAKKYNEVLAYFIDVVDTHSGLAGITNAELTTAKTLAEKTGDDGLSDKLDWVWNHPLLDQIDRIVSLLDYIQGKMATLLQ